MLYIPMFKKRMYEEQILRTNNQFFSDKIVPLIEIVKEHYRKTDFKVDPLTGDFVMEKHRTRELRARKDPTPDDIDTLSYIYGLVGGKKCFIDYFRFATAVYKKSFNPSTVELSINLNSNEKLYISKLKSVKGYRNLIPVLSIKKEFFPQKYSIRDLIRELQLHNEEIAIRLDDEAYEAFSDIVAPCLRECDYIMYDIGEQKTSSKVIELTSFNDLNTRGKKVLLNSPRKRSIQNGNYEDSTYTDLIDNSARDIGKEYPNIHAYGDYCGLKDEFTSKGGKPVGAALALLYDFSRNKFRTYVNPDIDDSIKGFRNIVPRIIDDSSLLDPENTCPVIREISEMEGTYGGWGTWIRLICTRYIHQMSSNL